MTLHRSSDPGTGAASRSVTSAIPLDERATLAAHPVDARLAEHARAYWTLTVAEPPARVRIVPDGQVDLVFDLDTAEAHIGGTRKAPFDAEHRRPTRLLGVTLLPGAAAALLDVAIDALAADWQPLAGVVGPVATALAERLAAPLTLAARLGLLDTFLLARLGQLDARVHRAVREIDRSDGRIDIARLGRHIGASPRNLSRLFHAWVGMSPKRFARIVRAQAALRRLADPSPPGLAELAAEIGFADQAHLAREVRAVAGIAPSKLAETFKRKSDPFKP